MLIFVTTILLILGLSDGKGLPAENGPKGDKECPDLPPYNSKYPFSEPTLKAKYKLWKIAIISDRDRASKVNDVNWESRFRTGVLIVSKDFKRAYVKWDPLETDKLINYDLAQKGRGMELSELVVFDGKLYTCCDRTGMVYQITDNGSSVLPFVHLNDGNGLKNKGYKCEWMTVKDELLWIGSTGKEWSTKEGVFVNHDPEWIKVVDRLGVVRNVNWTDYFLALRIKTDHAPPGYFFHESAVWSDVHNQWFFLPRKVSKLKYDDAEDEKRCGNLLLRTDQNFTNVVQKQIGRFNASRGFSSFKFVPESKDEVFVALKTVEIGNQVESYIGVYNINGHVPLKEKFISNEKFEGLEFI